MTNFPSFVIIFVITPVALTDCPPILSAIYMLCIAVPKDILVEVDSSFWSIKTIFEIVQASYKANKFLDVDYDIYTYGSYKSIYIDKYRSHNEVPPNGYIGIQIYRITHVMIFYIIDILISSFGLCSSCNIHTEQLYEITSLLPHGMTNVGDISIFLEGILRITTT